ncbi:MAG: hypothetical protein GY771_04755 [bacterium]|nr:hypothetical protein [bacterium]
MAHKPSGIEAKGKMGDFKAAAKARSKRAQEDEVHILIVSLIDTFIIIVIFLMQNFAAEGDIMSVSPDLTLPTARVDVIPVKSVNVMVTNNSIVVEGILVADTEDVLAAQDLVIPGLYEKMVSIADLKRAIAAADPSKEFKGEVNIQADKYITFELLKRVMYTCGRAEYGEISLAVLKSI